jgi:colicin import membrane protein
VLPNVVFNDDLPGNPKAEVEVSTTSDGTIMSQRLIKSSGNKARDDAVLRGIDATERLPRDIDGRVPSLMVLSVRQFG